MTHTNAMIRALDKGSTAPTTPDSDTPGYVLADCIDGQEQNWVEALEQRKPLRPSPPSRAGKPKQRHAHHLDRLSGIRRRRDIRLVPTCAQPVSLLSTMRRSGYVVKGDIE